MKAIATILLISLAVCQIQTLQTVRELRGAELIKCAKKIGIPNIPKECEDWHTGKHPVSACTKDLVKVHESKKENKWTNKLKKCMSSKRRLTEKRRVKDFEACAKQVGIPHMPAECEDWEKGTNPEKSCEKDLKQAHENLKENKWQKKLDICMKTPGRRLWIQNEARRVAGYVECAKKVGVPHIPAECEDWHKGKHPVSACTTDLVKVHENSKENNWQKKLKTCLKAKGL